MGELFRLVQSHHGADALQGMGITIEGFQRRRIGAGIAPPVLELAQLRADVAEQFIALGIKIVEELSMQIRRIGTHAVALGFDQA
jgi:hypothetical protein